MEKVFFEFRSDKINASILKVIDEIPALTVH